MRRTIGIVATLVAAGIGGGVTSLAYAQEKPCMADAARLCPDVEPGGGAQMACLKQHKEELSPACKKKVMQAKIKMEENKQLEQQKENAPPPPPSHDTTPPPAPSP
jgi:hypothetical protein